MNTENKVTLNKEEMIEFTKKLVNINDPSEVKEAFSKVGKDISLEDAKAVINLFNLIKEGKITKDSLSKIDELSKNRDADQLSEEELEAVAGGSFWTWVVVGLRVVGDVCTLGTLEIVIDLIDTATSNWNH